MNFYLTASILLVPLAFANVSPTTEVKIIYDNTTVITEQTDGTYLNYYNRIYDSAVEVYFGFGFNITIEDLRFETVKEAGYRFVAEKLSLPSNSEEFDCIEESDPSLRSLIVNCRGTVRVRELTDDEQMQIKEFKNNREEMDKKFKVVSRSGRLTSKSHDRLVLTVISTQPELNVSVFSPNPYVTQSNTKISGHNGKSFVVEGSNNTDCYPSPVKGLNVLLCKGNILVRDIKESD